MVMSENKKEDKKKLVRREMLNKLMKYDYRALFRVLNICYIGTLRSERHRGQNSAGGGKCDDAGRCRLRFFRHFHIRFERGGVRRCAVLADSRSLL